MLETTGTYLLLGAFAGTVAGLLGVGGGLIIVPVLVYMFHRQHFSSPLIIHLAVGTSLATIVMTAISSVRAHHRRGAVRWAVFRQLVPGIVLGALLGSQLAEWMPASVLRRFFAIFEWLVALQLFIGLRPRASHDLPRLPAMLGVGGVIGTVSSLVGIGGGSLTVPFLVWSRLRIQEAIATSSACALPIAIAGAAGFVATGWNHAGLPAYSLGYVYLPAFLGIVVASVVFAPLGARLAHRLPAQALRRFFAIFLTMLGFYMYLRH
ncbi:MAG: sulfite exporter TauE/SafE family protein [Gammaproteobacteria bacterium]|jgi:uncharacterized protein